MDSSDMKHMVVLKNLQSNLIEEAIVVLKSNVKVKIPQRKGESKEQKEKRSDYIIKEAEMHIAQYASGMENKIKSSRINENLERKYMRLKKLTVFFAILAALGMLVNMLK